VERQMNGLPGLTNLRSISISDCRRLDDIPDGTTDYSPASR